jgi:serine/threonine protein kinase
MSNEKSVNIQCNGFKPQLWRQDTCKDCFRLKLEHAEMILEKELLNKEDPTNIFELITIVGKGSYGCVCMCREKLTQKTVAIKFLEISKLNKITSIVNEINIMKESVDCPYIVEYYGCYMKDNILMVCNACNGILLFFII